MVSRAYDYACPAFGGFSVPPPSSWEPPSRRTVTAALIKQASIISNSGSMSRGNSLEGRPPLSRMDSAPRSPLARMDSGPRSPLARGDSMSSRTESYTSNNSTTSTGAGGNNYSSTTQSSYGTGPGGRPTMYSSATYTSPYGNNYRHFSYK